VGAAGSSHRDEVAGRSDPRLSLEGTVNGSNRDSLMVRVGVRAAVIVGALMVAAGFGVAASRATDTTATATTPTETAPGNTVTVTTSVPEPTITETVTTPAPPARTVTLTVAPPTSTTTQSDQSSSVDWGWVAFGVLAFGLFVGGIVWWLRGRHDRCRPTAPSP
jgi:hypothetical protein